MVKRIGCGLLLWMAFLGRAQAKEVPYTLEDRDRLIRVETSLKEFKEAVDQRFESIERRYEGIERRIERLESVMMWGFGLLFTSMLALMGFVLWDRRSALAPAIRKNREIEERENRVETALREIARKDANVAQALKQVGLL